jgi:GTP-binding protein Era
MGYKCGYVAIVGRPNVGKSTLINILLNRKISIVSKKPQTTRHKILAILTDSDSQIIFIDTPGLFKPKYELHRLMQHNITTAFAEADLILMLVDCRSFPKDDELKFIQDILSKNKKLTILAINKIDLIKKSRLLPLIDFYSKLYEFKEIIPISALCNDGIDILLSCIKNNLPEVPEKFYPEDFITDKPKEFFIEEFVREKIYDLCYKEIPYGTSVKVEDIKANNAKLYISAIIYIEKESQKGILIGKSGGMIKEIRNQAKVEIEKFLQQQVYLDLWVKVKKAWRKNLNYLKEFGYR